MKIEANMQMVPIYLSLLCYGVAFLTRLFDAVMTALASAFKRTRPLYAIRSARRIASILYFLGFLGAAVAFAVRWKLLDQIPLQSMFDVFLAMGVVIWPVTRFCRRLDAQFEPVDMLLGFALLYPVAFVFPSEAPKLPPALQSPFFIPHVAAYLLAYVILAKAAVHALCYLVRGDECRHRVRVLQEDGKTHDTPDSKFLSQLGQAHRDTLAAEASQRTTVYRHHYPSDTVAAFLVSLAFPLLTLGLVLGSWWGQVAWGNFWGWDPKEMWSLATWLIFVLFFHLRYSWPSYRRLASLVVIIGLLAVVITLILANLSRLFPGLHNYAGM